jgi:hypothetical protein
MSNARASSAATVVAVLLLVAVQNSFTHGAGAEKYNVVTLKTMSPDDLKKKCGDSGGTFENFGSDWSCTTKKGSVSCNSKQCTGVTPAASAPTPKHLRDPGPVLDSLSAQ